MTRPWTLASLFFALGCSSAPEPAALPASPPEPTVAEPASPEVTPPPAAGPSSPDESPEASAPPTAPPIDDPVAMPVLGRSGWEYEDHELAVATRAVGGAVLEGELCGLRVVLRHAPASSACDDAAFDARLRCMLGEYTPRVWLDDEDVEAVAMLRAQEATRLVLRDEQHEIALPAYPIASVGCLEGVAIVVPAAIEFDSRRSFVAVETSDGTITRVREVSIRDPLENQSDCGNAWDGVELLPIVGPSGLSGSLVSGAVASPRFELGVGEVGLSGVVEGTEPLLGYRLRDGILEGVPAGFGRAEECPIVVSDGDGETNVRPLPNTGRAPVGTLANGTRIDPVEQRGRWYRIDAPLAGWVFAASLARRCDDER